MVVNVYNQIVYDYIANVLKNQDIVVISVNVKIV